MIYCMQKNILWRWTKDHEFPRRDFNRRERSSASPPGVQGRSNPQPRLGEQIPWNYGIHKWSGQARHHLANLSIAPDRSDRDNEPERNTLLGIEKPGSPYIMPSSGQWPENRPLYVSSIRKTKFAEKIPEKTGFGGRCLFFGHQRFNWILGPP